MRKLFMFSILVILIMFANIASAATLKWDASTGDVDGYIVYYGTVAGEYPHNKDVKNVTLLENMEAVLHLHSEIQYFLGIAAYNSTGESGLSNIATYTRPAYIIPEDNLPDIVIEIPEAPDQLLLNFTH